MQSKAETEGGRRSDRQTDSYSMDHDASEASNEYLYVKFIQT